MSAGKFNIYKYETDAGKVLSITLQPETKAATFNGTTNVEPSGTIEAGSPSVTVASGRRSIGIHPRIVTIGQLEDVPTDYLPNQTYRVVCLSEATFTNLARGQAATYLGSTGKIISVTREKIR